MDNWRIRCVHHINREQTRLIQHDSIQANVDHSNNLAIGFSQIVEVLSCPYHLLNRTIILNCRHMTFAGYRNNANQAYNYILI